MFGKINGVEFGMFGGIFLSIILVNIFDQ
jgi:hypothetical protein